MPSLHLFSLFASPDLRRSFRHINGRIAVNGLEAHDSFEVSLTVLSPFGELSTLDFRLASPSGPEIETLFEIKMQQYSPVIRTKRTKPADSRRQALIKVWSGCESSPRSRSGGGFVDSQRGSEEIGTIQQRMGQLLSSYYEKVPRPLFFTAIIAHAKL